MNRSSSNRSSASRGRILIGASLVGLAAWTAWVARQARRADREHPPTGQLLDVDGVRLHCVERGEGPPVVLLHGNAVWHRDFEASGLMDVLATGHRVIAFDRPGFGHSSRPRDRLWTPTEQARLLHSALEKLGVERPVVVGHSLGAMVAMAMALDHPKDVRGLVLLGGYYYPTARIDAVLTAPVALPVVGDAMRYTVTNLLGRLLLKAMVKGMFSPREVPPRFMPFLSREMLLRPGQLRASAGDAAFMIEAARASSQRHKELRLPVAIIAGERDIVIDMHAHSVRLHADVPQSTLKVVPSAGHMVHYAALEEVLAAIRDASALRLPDSSTSSASIATEQVAVME